MTTIRVERPDRWTTIDRRLINDQRLSFRARGVLIWLLDKPDGWKVQSESIARSSDKEGRDAVRAALKELERLGYLERRKYRNDLGRWESEAVVRETPGRTRDGNPAPGFPTPENQALYRRLRPKTESRDSSTNCGQREFRNYDEPPLTPDQLAERYGVEA